MYVPSTFELDDEDAWAVVRDAGAGVLVVASPAGLVSVFVPVVVSADRRTMTTHVAKANPWWRAAESGADVLAVFLAASAYVTPSYYPSRLDDPAVVPTWNYVAAEVRGRVRVHQESGWKFAQVTDQTSTFEFERRPAWRVDESPRSYVDKQLKAIVGVEIEVTSIEGKAKLSQNRSLDDRRSVRDNLASGTYLERNVAQRMDQ
ncbi:MAG: FMN-binding negative transcriptional regulator [Acidimicrobiales bacterium]